MGRSEVRKATHGADRRRGKGKFSRWLETEGMGAAKSEIRFIVHKCPEVMIGL